MSSLELWKIISYTSSTPSSATLVTSDVTALQLPWTRQIGILHMYTCFNVLNTCCRAVVSSCQRCPSYLLKNFLAMSMATAGEHILRSQTVCASAHIAYVLLVNKAAQLIR